MASQEHLQMLNCGDSTSSTSSEDEDESTSSENEDVAPVAMSLGAMKTSNFDIVKPTPTPLATAATAATSAPVARPLAVSAGPAKKRIKLSLGNRTRIAPKLPMKNASKLPIKNAPKLPIKNAPKLPMKSAAKLPMNGTKKKKTNSRSTSPTVSDAPKPNPPMKKKITLKKLHDGFSSLSQKAVEGSTDDNEIKAMVVDSDDGGEDDAVAAVVDEAITPAVVSSAKGGAATPNSSSATSKKRPAGPVSGNPIRTVRFPAMSSPGLMMPAAHGSGIYREIYDENGMATPSDVFDHAMSLAGYTLESRTKLPHRGSSVKRVVGDMFDSNVKFALHFPNLVPPSLLDSKQPKSVKPSAADSSTSTMNGTSNGSTPHKIPKSLPDRLLDAFHVSSSVESSEKEKQGENECHDSADTRPNKVRRKLAQFSNIAPLSITMQYPQNYLKKRMEYIGKVNEREKAIVDYQEKEEALEVEHEKMANEGKVGYDTVAPKPDIKIPPIPEPPEPPLLKEMAWINPDSYEGDPPLYFPKGKRHLEKHLDKNCFRIVDGRYFGLVTNSVADPHFIGPNAPGVTGIPLSGGAGLATSNTGGAAGSAMGGGLLVAATVQSVSQSIPAANKTHTASAAGPSSKSTTKKSSSSNSTSNGTSNKSNANNNGEGNSNKKKEKKKASSAKATATASSLQLRKQVEEGGETAEKMKQCIIRAAVYASRSGKHGQPFRAPDGEVYPDISKAFASHAGIKPCNRCKNNKQGAYHCRLRRKHKELDFDGGNSWGILEPLFALPMDELLCKAPPPS